MAIQLVNRVWCNIQKGYKNEYVMDTADDAASLPECCPGSTAYTADKDMKLYMVNASGEWKEL